MPREQADGVWTERLLANPHAVADKRTRIQRMFAAIAPSYDINNRIHSLWQDQRWRRKAVRLAALQRDDVVVDVACGTGDLTMALAQGLGRQRRAILGRAQVFGIDFTHEMLPLARAKADRRYFPGNAKHYPPPSFISSIHYLNADALALPLADTSADVVSIAFGIRNVTDPAAALREFRRILRPGGRLVILEFSLPTNPMLRGLYNFYFRRVLPRTATLISRDRTGAYRYLPESVNTFIGRRQMLDMMRSAGFGRVEQHPLTLGICVCYRGFVAG